MLKNFKGITLIVLVVTIVVLLILAGVTIATLTGDNGILIRANEAKEKIQIASEDELRKLTMLEAATNLENTVYTDKNNKTVTIPAGFAVSQVEGENKIDTGLVIIDVQGNEFVWIPVSKENFETEFVRREGYYNGKLQSISNCGESDATGNNTNSEVRESKTTQKEAQDMYKSIEKNGGFYVGRYEAGKEDNENVIIQKGATVYNYVTWSRNGQMDEESIEIAEGVEGTKSGAIELARNFDTANNYTTVTSTLCYAVQWDTIMKWMENEPNLNGGKYIQDSTGMGWYSDNFENGNAKNQTGIDLNGGKNKVKNIYDLAGNVYEWTMEAYLTNNRVGRGGGYDYTGLYDPASNRSIYRDPSFNNAYTGFRITLYLN